MYVCMYVCMCMHMTCDVHARLAPVLFEMSLHTWDGSGRPSWHV